MGVVAEVLEPLANPVLRGYADRIFDRYYSHLRAERDDAARMRAEYIRARKPYSEQADHTLRELFNVAVAAAQPDQVIGGYLGDEYDKRMLITIAMLGHGGGLLAASGPGSAPLSGDGRYKG